MSSTIVHQHQQRRQQMGDLAAMPASARAESLLADDEVGGFDDGPPTQTLAATPISHRHRHHQHPELGLDGPEQLDGAPERIQVEEQRAPSPTAAADTRRRRDSLSCDALAASPQHCNGGDVVTDTPAVEFILLEDPSSASGGAADEAPAPSAQLACASGRSDSLPNGTTATPPPASVTAASPVSGAPLEAATRQQQLEQLEQLELGAQQREQHEQALGARELREDDDATQFQHLEARLERSNSCSQAEQCQAQQQQQQQQLGGQLASLGRSASSSSNSNVSTSNCGANHNHITDHNNQLQPRAQPPSSKPQPAAQSTSSSRFFSSKLNTGSLWSLLSTGSTCSSSAMSEQQANTSLQAGEGQPAQASADRDESIGSTASAASVASSASLLSSSFTSSTNSFLSRYQSFSRPKQPQQPQQQQQHPPTQQQQQPHHQQPQQPDSGRRRFRFSIKYIGTSILSRNFTLPMLEWIARDIKRQTVRGAPSTSQRQFTIPARDILLDIQHHQLTAVSCKDGHCIFVHPMHCVSKYVQLQHDPTSFAYIIRDAKEAPSFVHVFQAKSANKVHDIFTTIREVATLTSPGPGPGPANPNAGANQQRPHPAAPLGATSPSYSSSHLGSGGGSNNNNRLQKSASTDGHWRSLLTDRNQAAAGQASASSSSWEPKVSGGPPASSPPTETAAPGGSSSQHNSRQRLLDQQQQQHQHQRQLQASSAGSSAGEAALQFENSYQFEVMFVKRVKLQCRRVPPTFVDDALETLKSFEVLKGGLSLESKAHSAIKGGLGKRIIAASVDERQEYDESCQSPPPPTLVGSQSKSAHDSRPSGAVASKRPDQQLGGSSVSLNAASQANPAESSGAHPVQGADQARESKSCQQSPTKPQAGTQAASPDGERPAQQVADPGPDQQQQQPASIKKHQSMDCLKSLDYTIRSSRGAAAGAAGPIPAYANDFSPYSTITSSDLNERIAAIPVVSGNSVSLDHETRQKLARQVRETIMATAANIKQGVYASGDKLDSTASSKALDSLSCIAPTTAAPGGRHPPQAEACGELRAQLTTTTSDQDDQQQQQQQQRQEFAGNQTNSSVRHSAMDQQDETSSGGGGGGATDQRRSSTASLTLQRHQQQSISNNFDLFRRASARQVVKNRTMLLLIGRDELCAISIDKHQILFSKSFNSIVHCLQGSGNRDHFGLICRDSGKINPQTESYAGFVFKCQSEKVVREIMGALKQVIYSSQHNYHGHNSPYNPLNSLNKAKQQQQQQQQPTHHHQAAPTAAGKQQASSPASQQQDLSAGAAAAAAAAQQTSQAGQMSLTMKRGFAKPIELLGAHTGPPRQPAEASATSGETPATRSSGRSVSLTRQHQSVDSQPAAAAAAGGQVPPAQLSLSPPTTAPIMLGGAGAGGLHQTQTQPPGPAKNPIRSMFCDQCPLYWYHRLCCDIESLPAEASKAIILRRIDCSLTDKEQDEVYSRFSEFNIETIDEHNEIFMSILRHQCERKQLKHSSSQSHLAGIAKNQLQQLAIASSNGGGGGGSVASQQASKKQQHQQQAAPAGGQANAVQPKSRAGGAHHQRSGSTSGSLAHILGVQAPAGGGGGAANQAAGHHQSLADASSAAIDNLKKAKNSISVSIENMLKRRSSLRDADEAPQAGGGGGNQLTASSSGGSNAAERLLRSGSFKSDSRASRAAEHQQQQQQQSASSSSMASSGDQNHLKRSQSTSDYSQAGGGGGSSCGNVAVASQQQQQQPFRLPAASWRDSLTRTLNETELSNPLAGLFGARNHQTPAARQPASARGSSESLSAAPHPSSESRLHQQQQQHHQPGGPGSPRHNQGGGISPSSVLSGVFWKKSIFDKIRQPAAPPPPSSSDTFDQRSPTPRLEIVTSVANNCCGDDKIAQQQQQQRRPRRSGEELRRLWRKAILEQITLLKMDKQNQKLQQQAPPTTRTPAGNSPADDTQDDEAQDDDHDDDHTIQRIKLNYADVPYVKEARFSWDRLLRQDPTRKVDFVEVARVVRLGVPKQRRGEAWMFLMNQYQIRHGTSFQPADSDYKGDANQTYRSLLSQLSTQQHEIFVDIGRTFPSHPYYSQYLSIGQLSLFNLLKAYSLLDQEVGYCQGLSFVAGILLLHVDSEDEAFELMRHLLFNFGLRKQYLPSMNALHLQLYQLTRLLRDHEFAIFSHFDAHDISPSLYAAPWFLTLFASQFPLGFVARLLDLIFLIGIEAIFRVSLTLVAYHRQALLRCTNLESTIEFIRNELVQIDSKNLARIFDQSMSLDLRNKLIEYEIEYSFYCAEDKARGSGSQAISITKSLSSSSNQAMQSTGGPDDQQQQRQQQPAGDAEETRGPNQMSSNSNNKVDDPTSEVADATATVIIQHLLATNHLKSLRSNYTY